MANKIVQLQDKTNTDNLFPIAGGMAADSITTAMIQDGAVTTDKLADSSVSTAKVADKAVTLSKIDFGNAITLSDSGLNNIRLLRFGKHALIRGLIVVNGTSTTRNTASFVLRASRPFDSVPAVGLNTNLDLTTGNVLVYFTKNGTTSTDVNVTSSTAITYAAINCWIEIEE